MIECTNCETAQFLQITRSRVYFIDGNMMNEVSEAYECTLCGATGHYDASGEDGSIDVSGSIRLTDARPKFA